MDLPSTLKNALEKEAASYSMSTLKASAQNVSEIYRNAERKGVRLVTDEAAVMSYALSRMPATFGAVSAVLENVSPCATLLDVGAGTGAGAWAALEAGTVQSAVCLEREEAMRTLGARLMIDTHPDVAWQAFDLAEDTLNQKADMVMASYVLNELAPSERLSAMQKLWQATQKTLVLLEPGTPAGFEVLRAVRTYLLKQGAFMTVPCPACDVCPMTGDNWCHFTCRVARSKIHKALKGGDAPYEDEKFAYLVLSRTPVVLGNARILRHPKIEKGKITLQLCTKSGLQTRVVTKREGDLFTRARKSNAGDIWDD